mmetsp:Transcript_89627/g.238073  ORF Transcript_89627/g.238073 Transcript_89627/m.238073 type:complete len:269 (-) Transcript_89627:639-1445(-)
MTSRSTAMALATCSAIPCKASPLIAGNGSDPSLGSDQVEDEGVSPPRPAPGSKLLAVLAALLPGARPLQWLARLPQWLLRPRSEPAVLVSLGLVTACNSESWLWTICANSLTCRSSLTADLLSSCCIERAICRALRICPPPPFAWPRPDSSDFGETRNRTIIMERTTGMQRTSLATPCINGKCSTSSAVSTCCSLKRLSFVRRLGISSGWSNVSPLKPWSFSARRTAWEQDATQPGCSSSSSEASSEHSSSTVRSGNSFCRWRSTCWS